MSHPYSRLARAARVELMEQKSRFIALGRPVEDEAEAIAFLAAVRSEFPDARHHVYAYALSRDQFLQRYSDDGEPAGTAGVPVLNILQRNGLSQSIVVVVRYFGGILLGTGGLTRAYGRSAALCVREAGIERLLPALRYRITLPYGDYDALLRLMPRLGAHVDETNFGLDAEAIVSVPLPQETAFLDQVNDLSRGGALLEPAGTGYLTEPVEPAEPPD